MSSTVKQVSKCSKKPGEFCRLHNPAPKNSGNTAFGSVEDVFRRLNNPEPVMVAGFQNINQVRSLPADVPYRLTEHQELSLKNAEWLTDEQRKVITGYSGMGAGVVNVALLGESFSYLPKAPKWRETDSPIDFQDREELVSYINVLDSVLENRSSERKVVYRGISVYDSLKDKIMAATGVNIIPGDTKSLVEGLTKFYKPGSVMENPSYLSTSRSALVAADWSDGGIVFELKTNAGVDITGVGRDFRAWEREVVLPRDTRFKVVNVFAQPGEYKTVSGYDDEDSPDSVSAENFDDIKIVVQMVEVDKDGNEIIDALPHKPVNVDRIVK